MSEFFDQTLATEINELKRNVNSLSSARQPYQGDWFEFTEEMVYTSSSEMTISNTEVDLQNVFAVGDPIRYKQGGGFKYGYVAKNTGTVLTVRSGSDYTISNAPITDVAKGLRLNASGFPVVFEFDPDFSAAPGTYSQSNPSLNEFGSFYMVGPIVYLEFASSFFSILTSPSVVLLSNLPVTASTTKNGTNWTLLACEDSAVSYVGFAKFGGINTIEIYKNALNPFSASWAVQNTNSAFFQLKTFIYICDGV